MKKLHSCILSLLAAGAAIGLTACSTTGDSVATTGGKIARKGEVIKVRTTAYTHSEPDHRRYGAKNAVGTQLRDRGICSAAADWSRIPYGTKFKILQTGETFMVDDYGSALVGTNTIDLYKPSYRAMNDWGVRHVDIKILSIGSYSQSAAILAPRRKYDHVDKMARVMEKRKVKPNAAPIQAPAKVGPAPSIDPNPAKPSGYYYVSTPAPKKQAKPNIAAPAKKQQAAPTYYAAVAPKKPAPVSNVGYSAKKPVKAGPGVPAPALAAGHEPSSGVPVAAKTQFANM